MRALKVFASVALVLTLLAVVSPATAQEKGEVKLPPLPQNIAELMNRPSTLLDATIGDRDYAPYITVKGVAVLEDRSILIAVFLIEKIEASERFLLEVKHFWFNEQGELMRLSWVNKPLIEMLLENLKSAPEPPNQEVDPDKADRVSRI